MKPSIQYYPLSALDDPSYEIVLRLSVRMAKKTHYPYPKGQPMTECELEFPFPPLSDDP